LALGPRFSLFLPVGPRDRLEYECACMLEAYEQPYESIMAMPVSRRHRFIKIREAIVEKQGKNNSGETFTANTGINPRMGAKHSNTSFKS